MELTEYALQYLDHSSGPKGLIEAIEVMHSKWDSPIRYINNSNMPIMLTHEDGSSHPYSYAGITISRSTDSDTLEQELNFMFGDLGEIVPQLVDRFIKDEEIELPIVNYRAYWIGQYDKPVFIAKGLELDKITRDWQGANCQSKAPSLNDLGNGDIYNATDDPAMAGFY